MKTVREMSEQLYADARQELKDGLAQCTEVQQLLFKRMYSHRNLERDINDVVDDLPEEKLSWATEQVQTTLRKKED